MLQIILLTLAEHLLEVNLATDPGAFPGKDFYVLNVKGIV
jgi:hypothetical protein